MIIFNVLQHFFSYFKFIFFLFLLSLNTIPKSCEIFALHPKSIFKFFYLGVELLFFYFFVCKNVFNICERLLFQLQLGTFQFDCLWKTEQWLVKLFDSGTTLAVFKDQVLPFLLSFSQPLLIWSFCCFLFELQICDFRSQRNNHFIEFLNFLKFYCEFRLFLFGEGRDQVIYFFLMRSLAQL